VSAGSFGAVFFMFWLAKIFFFEVSKQNHVIRGFVSGLFGGRKVVPKPPLMSVVFLYFFSFFLRFFQVFQVFVMFLLFF
jgi:hypothetical protein